LQDERLTTLFLTVQGGGAREWSRQELEIVEVAADQLAVALSHAAVPKEWQLTRHKLAERQRVLVQARHDAAVATRARDASQSAMRDVVLRPMHSVAGLLSLMQAQQQEDEAFHCAEQRVAVDAMARISAFVSACIGSFTSINQMISSR
jgi:ethylene receptor